MEEIIERLGKYFVSLDRSGIEWTASGIVKTGKKITDVSQQVKYIHAQTAMEALSKLESYLIGHYQQAYKVDIINSKK